MTYYKRYRAFALLLLATVWAGAAAAQSYEVRTFLAPSDAAVPTDGTFQYLQSSIKSRYVCPYCSFSCETLPAGGRCPDPWNATGHPANVDLVDMGTQLRERLLSLAGPAMPANQFDLWLPDYQTYTTGNLVRRAILGRPFSPQDAGNTRRSNVYAQVAGLVNNNAADGPVIQENWHGRFLVVPPTPLMTEENLANPAAARTLPSRKIMGRVDTGVPASGGNAAWGPRQITDIPGALTDLPGGLAGYLDIGVNPYRVDDGDYWFVRYQETTDAGNTVVTESKIEIYSVNYGYMGTVGTTDANSDGFDDPEPLTISNPTFPFTVVVDNGAARLTFNKPDGDAGWSSAASVGTTPNLWVCGFMVRSTCRLIPGWRDMHTDSAGTEVDPLFPNRDNPGGNLGTAVANWSTYEFRVKQPWFNIGPNTAPNFTTESPLTLWDTATPKQATAYTLPVNAVGQGTVAVQWAADATGSFTHSPSPDALTYGEVYRRPDGEWHYDAAYNPVKDVTNDNIANQTANYGSGLGFHVQLLAGRFMSSRVAVAATQQNWRPDGSLALDPVEPAGVDWAYPRAVLGVYSPDTAVPGSVGTFDPTTNQWLNGGLITGDFAPGSTTAARPLNQVNRYNGSAALSVCRKCGATWVRDPVVTDCPYHEPPPAAVTAWDVSLITDPAYSDYNGRYDLDAAPYNGKPCYKKSDNAHYLFWLTAENRWVMAATLTNDYTQCPYRGAPGKALPATNWQRRNTPAATRPDKPLPWVAVATAPGEIAMANVIGGGNYRADCDQWREATAYTPDERTAGAPLTKHTLAASTFRTRGQMVAQNANLTNPAADSLAAVIPPHQAPSVPGGGVLNDRVHDYGYRGGQVYHHNLTAPNANSGLTAGWNTFYHNPDLGYFQPDPFVWPYLDADGNLYWENDPAGSWICTVDREVFHAAGNCPTHGGALVALAEALGRHYLCTVCGAEYPNLPASGVCAFEGSPILDDANHRVPLNEAVREEHLMSEEYDPFDVQVSVSRTATRVAQNAPNVDLGRTAPGVQARQPDLTVQPAAAGLLNHRAFPAEVSPLPQYNDSPSDVRVSLRNEGNVALLNAAGSTPLLLGNTFNNGASDDFGLPHYLRVEVDPNVFSYGRMAQGGPLTRNTMVPLAPIVGSANSFENAMTLSTGWDSYAGSNGQVAGAQASGFLSAGRNAQPVPLGQPVGSYVGQHLQYVDLDGDDAFAFYSLAGGANTTTETTQFNPAVDLPLEPLVGVLSGQTRVFETRLPQNDYYAMDSDPIVLPTPAAGVMQVMWSTNRALIGGGLTPANLAQPTSAVNLVYADTVGVPFNANDELYRRYNWTTGAGGALTPPAAMTNFPAGTVNGQPWVMYNAAQSARFAFWHQSMANAGGTQSTLWFNQTAGAAWPVIGSGATNFIFDSGLPKQGLRGFSQAGGAWLFWHSGTAGRERLMYTWNFNGTPASNREVPLPVTNQAPASQAIVGNPTVQGETDLVNATLPGGTTYLGDGTALAANTAAILQRPTVSPFTYTKDTSVFVNNGQVNTFFSGFVTQEGQSDICWSRFNLAQMGATAAAANNNFGKVPFPSVFDWEEMQNDGLHQQFGSRHLDWLVDRNFARSGRDSASINPTLRLQVAFRDVIGDGAARETMNYTLDWTGGTYDRARGVYRVTPIFYPWTGASLPLDHFIAVGSGGYLRDRLNSQNKLTMEINIAAGTVQFSSPLFNPDAASDPSCALRSTFLSAAGQPLDDVILRVNYTPYIYRVTRNEAQDDSPSAFYDSSAVQRLTVFWRRSYPTSEAPHFGHAAFMYKAYTTSIQVGRPPVTGTIEFRDGSLAGTVVTPNATLPDAGIYNFDAALTKHYLYALYGSHTERHQVIGWSREMPVPVDTVVGEGALVAVPESFNVPSVEGVATNMIPTTRYWLYWSSPRGVYDLRLVENNGTRVSPGASGAHDQAVHASSDIYTAVVAPEFGSLTPEPTVSTVSPTGT